MTDPSHALTLQFLAWIAERPRPYGEVMEAWRTSCPRLSIWEDALDAGLVGFEEDRPGAGGMRGRRVHITAGGLALLGAPADAAGSEHQSAARRAG